MLKAIRSLFYNKIVITSFGETRYRTHSHPIIICSGVDYIISPFNLDLLTLTHNCLIIWHKSAIEDLLLGYNECEGR